MVNKSVGVSSRLAGADGLLENSLGMLFCKIPAGTFSMGSTLQESESPVHPAPILHCLSLIIKKSSGFFSRGIFKRTFKF